MKEDIAPRRHYDEGIAPGNEVDKAIVERVVAVIQSIHRLQAYSGDGFFGDYMTGRRERVAAQRYTSEKIRDQIARRHDELSTRPNTPSR